MAFTVDDFHDLVALLEQRPDWRTELRRLVLSEELLNLPALVHELVEAQRRAEARREGVEARLERVEARLEGVEDRLTRLEVTVEKLLQVQQHSEEHLARLDTRVDALRGSDLERRFRERVHAYLGRTMRRVHVLTGDELAALVEDGVDAGAALRGRRMVDAGRSSVSDRAGSLASAGRASVRDLSQVQSRKSRIQGKIRCGYHRGSRRGESRWHVAGAKRGTPHHEATNPAARL